ncbi:hypothetical protein [Actinoplanes rectilineatus]|uniref:hypothetical protein n=1 Tax=Actinoplanes rectilineatus TaxID=113571 RepID=UPI0012F75030|nr:hypothetical protein [Actinoplanes rectilineatus]
MTSNLKSALRRSLGRVSLYGWARRSRVTASRRLTPARVQVVTCCRGWYFEHSAECRTPHLARPCSDCYAEPGSAHIYLSCSWFDVEPVVGPDETEFWPDAARWPGHPIAE